jgi:hypothetical protein
MKVVTVSIAMASMALLPIAQARHTAEMIQWQMIFGNALCSSGGNRGPVPVPQHPDHNAMTGCHGVLTRRLRIHHTDGSSTALD